MKRTRVAAFLFSNLLAGMAAAQEGPVTPPATRPATVPTTAPAGGPATMQSVKPKSDQEQFAQLAAERGYVLDGATTTLHAGVTLETERWSKREIIKGVEVTNYITVTFREGMTVDVKRSTSPPDKVGE